ncbi:topoisomerase DNA-binding C4 zinc finger domain-containing protein [Shewanella avicenniae]|uniref:Topoisomerase DNA-binding C4 zinc finger domain-containing protein n=1 Tax=Shewanella avicenniae TaxID=2814294 RepID=A0ABX7QSN6_9GAMM|nr:topoisomerase DNA-binding C4 zinc finger domain-containing protein [Shewanella avicenniae]QSX33713.1 topoisomerase DNA-binding C4 zinc finger domain-containing protein [Shewanella avicenniae]
MAKIDQQLFNAKAHALEKEFELCPKCGAELNIRHSKHGSFLGCCNYPQCDYSRPLVQHESIESQPIPGSECPDCGAELAVKSGRFGIFIGCTNYPECRHIEKHTQDVIEQQVQCPQCQTGFLETKTNRYGKTFFACSGYPKCRFVVNYPPHAETCPQCGFRILVERKTASGKRLECPSKSCNYKRPV